MGILRRETSSNPSCSSFPPSSVAPPEPETSLHFRAGEVASAPDAPMPNTLGVDQELQQFHTVSMSCTPYTLLRKQSAPVLVRHRKRRLGSPARHSNSSSAPSRSARHEYHYSTEPYTIPSRRAASRQRDSERLLRRPPSMNLGRWDNLEPEVGLDAGSSRSHSVSTGLPTPITIPSIPEFMRIPSLLGTSTITPSAHLPLLPKGHAQSHVTNLPQRRRREPKYTEAEVLEQRRWEWERRTVTCEVGSGSGIFVSFTSDQDDDDFSLEFMSVVDLIPEGTQPRQGSSIPGDGDRRLQISTPSTAIRDDGMPHLTVGQLQSAYQFFRKNSAHFTTLEPGSRPKLLLITTARERPADALALAILLLASLRGPRSQLPSPPCSSPPALGSPKFASSMDVDDPPHALDTNCDENDANVSANIIHSVVMELHDVASEDDGYYLSSGGLKGPWRGVLSRDGMDFLEHCLSEL